MTGLTYGLFAGLPSQPADSRRDRFLLSLLMTFGYSELGSTGNRPPQYWIRVVQTPHGITVSFPPKI